MELLTYPKSEYLLDASIESLHAESKEWLRDIEFWKDEMTFFYNILNKKEVKTAFPTNELAALEKKLISIDSDKIATLRKQVQSHEQTLMRFVKTLLQDEEETYRETHRVLLNEIYTIASLIKDFKKEVFSFVQKYK